MIEEKETPPLSIEPRVERRVSPWLTLLVLCLGFFMILLDTTIVNIAFPSIKTSLNAGFDQVLWVLNAYILVYAVLLISAGRLGDLRGQRNLFILGLFIFTGASALCGFAQDANQLIAARVLQGIGGAILTPQTLSIITTIFPPSRRGAAFGVWGAVAGVAAVAGPTLGGFIVTNFDWRWIFYVNLPVGAVTILLAFLLVPNIKPNRKHRLDLVGVVLSGGGLLAVCFGLIEGQRYNWGAVWEWVSIPYILTVGAALLLLFFAWERGEEEPLIPLGLFGERNFGIMNWVSVALAFGMFGIFLPVTFYFQLVLGMSALNAGLAIAPMPFTSMLIAPLAGRLSDRLGGKYILILGLLAFGGGFAWLGAIADTGSTWQTFLAPLILSGFGLGCTFAPLATVAMASVKPQQAGAASGVLNTSRQVGGVLGSAVAGAVLQNRLADAFVSQASAQAQNLPAGARPGFEAGFAHAAAQGFEGGGTNFGTSIPQSVADQLPYTLLHQMEDAGHAVFANSFVLALRPTLTVAVAGLAVAALSCLFIAGRRGAALRRQP
ncbi:MAG: DHA2 family efflux MFS transporter permease subunit [Candidatus Dormibacteria bacterium]